MPKGYNEKWIGRQVKIVFQDSGMTLEELASRTGMHENSLGQLMLGKRNPTWRTLMRICQALGITPYQLIVAGTPLAALVPREPSPRRAMVHEMRRRVIETQRTMPDCS